MKIVKIIISSIIYVIILFLILKDFNNNEATELIILISIMELGYLLTLGLFDKKIDKLSSEKIRLENLDKIDFSKDKDYYRDIINKYSIGELMYIDNLSYDIKKQVYLTLLKLENKKYIEITDEKIHVLNKDKVNFRKDEFIILNSIVKNKIIINNKNKLYDAIIAGCQEDNLVSNVENVDSKIIKGYIEYFVYAVFFMLFIIMSPVVFHNKFINTVIPFLGIVGLLFFMAKMVYQKAYSKNLKKFYKRTKIGNELNIKLEGLKLFLKDFTALDKAEEKSIKLWDEYLLYAGMFDINNKIIKDLSKKSKYYKKYVNFTLFCLKNA